MVGVIGLVACQAYLPQPLDPQASAQNFGKRRLDDPQLRTALVASGRWPRHSAWPPAPWRLAQLQSAALVLNPEMAVAKAKAATATAGIVTANTKPNPAVSIGPEYGVHAGEGVSPWVLGFSLDMPIETANKRGERTAQAQAQANAAALAIADTGWTVIAGVRAALLELETTTQRLVILETQADNDAALVAMAADRVKAGDAPRTELATYQSQHSRDLLELAAERGKSDSARAKLATALGVPAISLSTTAVSFGALDHFPVLPAEHTLRKAALQRRSDVLGALEDYAAADAALRLEIAKQTPDLNLKPGYTFDQGQSKWALGVGITLPLDRNRGPILEASAKRDQAAAVFERLQIGIRGELDQALATFQSDQRRLGEVEKLLASQRQQLADAQRLTQAGEGNKFAELAALALVRQAELARLDALAQAQQSLGKLEDSTRLSCDEN